MNITVLNSTELFGVCYVMKIISTRTDTDV